MIATATVGSYNYLAANDFICSSSCGSSAMNFYPKPIKLHDCREHGLGSELFLVEGDSASKTVARARDSRFQAVLPMQGKPMNAMKASRNAAEKNELFRILIDCLGADWGDDFDLQAVRYERVILLFDPDADGIHCGALMLMFFFRWMRPLLESGRLCVVRPPLYEITSKDYTDAIHAYSEDHYRKLRDALDEKKVSFKGQRYRGLASMNDDTLSKTCLDPETRRINRLENDDAQAAIAAFGGKTIG